MEKQDATIATFEPDRKVTNRLSLNVLFTLSIISIIKKELYLTKVHIFMRVWLSGGKNFWSCTLWPFFAEAVSSILVAWH